MAVTTTINPGPRSTELDGLDKAIKTHPIWTELRGPDTLNYTDPNGHDPGPRQCDNVSSSAKRGCYDYFYTGICDYTSSYCSNRHVTGIASAANTQECQQDPFLAGCHTQNPFNPVVGVQFQVPEQCRVDQAAVFGTCYQYSNQYELTKESQRENTYDDTRNQIVKKLLVTINTCNSINYAGATDPLSPNAEACVEDNVGSDINSVEHKPGFLATLNLILIAAPGVDIEVGIADLSELAVEGTEETLGAADTAGDVASNLPKLGVKPNFTNPAESPGAGWEWRGTGDPGTSKGSWYNPSSGESLHPDLGHPDPIGPHYDWKAPDGTTYRVYPDGTVVPK